ncbi:MAG TPA: hypothetical protein VFG00_02280, partial [Acidothermaceae bacterium]|nr:hypothetical protein [Acidothermaceae bacterium]
MTEDGGQQRPWWASPSDQLQEPPELPPARDSAAGSTEPARSDSVATDAAAPDSRAPASPRYGADPYLGPFPYAKPENGVPPYTPPVYTVP